MRRRDFIRHGSVGSAALVAGLRHFPYHLYAGTQVRSAQDRVMLGKTGIEVSRLAQGTGTNGTGGTSRQSRLGVEGLAELLRAGVDQGLNFWDVADDYGSHPSIKEALKTVPRDKVVVMTKTDTKDEKGMRAKLDQYRKEMGVDMIDIVLMHCVWAKDWPKRWKGAMEVLGEAKEQGIIRAHGISCHSIRALKVAAATDWVDVGLTRLNPVGSNMDAGPEVVVPILELMGRMGKGVLGMKILGAGELRGEVDKAVQYAAAPDSPLDAFTIGAENRKELEDLLAKLPPASVRG